MDDFKEKSDITKIKRYNDVNYQNPEKAKQTKIPTNLFDKYDRQEYKLG
jgi:hypothetical protein